MLYKNFNDNYLNSEPISLPNKPYSAERGYRAMQKISESARQNGLSEMTLEEINAEIEVSRKERAIPTAKSYLE